MNKIFTIAALGGTMMASAVMLAPATADAAIRCQGGNQWNSAVGGWIPSPYCGDKLIAAISGYAFHGPNGIRSNPSTKSRACRFAGSDIRIRDLCAGHLPEDQGGKRP